MVKDKQLLRKKRIIGIISFAVCVFLFCFLAYFIVYKFFANDTSVESFAAFIESYGWAGRFVALGIQFLQVFVAVIPGEFVEMGLGFVFGAVEGTILCFVGVGLASAAVFVLVKKWGVRFVELFIEREKIDSLKFINSENKLNTVVFVLFLIPGTPKDLLTYIVPLTKMKLAEFMVCSMLARIPSVISSTIGGNLFSKAQYLEGILLFAITGVLSVAGLLIYRRITEKRHEKKEKLDSE